MPSDSKTDDRRPAATEAAREVLFRHETEGVELVNPGVRAEYERNIWADIDAKLDALEAAGLTITAAPLSGQVCVDDDTEIVTVSLATAYYASIALKHVIESSGDRYDTTDEQTALAELDAAMEYGAAR